MAKHKQVVDAEDAQADLEGEGGAIMSNVMTAGHLRDEIDKKLSQAKGICIVASQARSPIGAALWAAEELIEDAKKSVDALYEQASRSVEKAVQP